VPTPSIFGSWQIVHDKTCNSCSIPKLVHNQRYVMLTFVFISLKSLVDVSCDIYPIIYNKSLYIFLSHLDTLIFKNEWAFTMIITNCILFKKMDYNYFTCFIFHYKQFIVMPWNLFTPTLYFDKNYKTYLSHTIVVCAMIFQAMGKNTLILF